MNGATIRLRGVRVHNLQGIDLDLPLGRFTVLTGVSGAGKSSLAFDTLYAESQRRYVETFPASARQFLERLDPPEADEIGPLPPAVAVRQSWARGSRRATLGSMTDVLDLLRNLWARAGEIVCPECQVPVERHSSASVAQRVMAWSGASPSRVQVAFPAFPHRAKPREPPGRDPGRRLNELRSAGFTRLILGDVARPLSDVTQAEFRGDSTALVVVDRLSLPVESAARLTDSLEMAFRHGEGTCLLIEEDRAMHPRTVHTFHTDWICAVCARRFPDPDPAILSFQSPLGACSTCQGLGTAPPPPRRRRTDSSGRDEHPGWSDDARGKLPPCPECSGTRLQPESLAICFRGRNIADISSATVEEALAFLSQAGQATNSEIAQSLLPGISHRLQLLCDVGLGYLTLDRPWRSLSRGEWQRARIAAACGSKLVNLLYLLDEPTSGLHAAETDRLLGVLDALRDAGNTIIAVEHDPAVIARADHVVELGPGGGKSGGRVVRSGAALISPESAPPPSTAPAGEEGRLPRRQPTDWIRLSGVHCHNLHGLDVEFPLGVVCCVTGVSGSGKSSLVIDSLLPAVRAALAQRRSADQESAPPVSVVTGVDALEAVRCFDSAPFSRSLRSHPASLLGIFAEIRSLFAGAAEARVRNLTPRHFSLASAEGGACATCRGAGTVAIDMQFLPDVVAACPDCHGTRFRSEILEVKHRGLSIAEVLALSAQEAFPFFRGRTRIQRRIRRLKEAGLDYLQLGQPAGALSGGEFQRLRLAAFLAQGRRARTLIVLDEPTTGLHPQDVRRLRECWDGLLAAGHSLVIIEHHLEVIRAADWVIDLGPGAGELGGRVVASGPPEQIARNPDSATGRWLTVYQPIRKARQASS